VTAEHDRKFFDTFMLVIGCLMGIAALLYVLSRVVAANTQEQHVLEDPAMKAAVSERIEPVAKLAVAGQDNTALAPAQPAAAAQQDLEGESVYNMACIACHGAGVAGAPKLGDPAAWGSRISKGIATLHEHALKGFQGQAGFMPAKGGRVDLSDKSITNAVDYMVSKSK
jgi:cytochrome c5